MSNRFIDKMLKRVQKPRSPYPSFLRYITSGSFLKSDMINGNSSYSDIKSKINSMRALAGDSQISTALSYYATDATTTNTAGQIIWATSDVDGLADLINSLFKKWKVIQYARDHILEIATIGNLYIPTSIMYGEQIGASRHHVALNNNTIPDDDFDIVPSYKIPPEDIIHVWFQGEPKGYLYYPSDDTRECIDLPEEAVIHFSLGGLLGEYTIDAVDGDGNQIQYDIQFAEPLLSSALSPTQTLALLEDATILSSFARVIKFVNVDCSGAEQEQIMDILQRMKDTIEQQFALNTITGGAQSFLNPQSPNNLIYLPKVNGTDAVSITDLNMADLSEADNDLLNYYQDKKLSVLGVPKEAMNFSSAEGLGNAGTVMSQRSALYANILNRIETAYISGWTDAINKYFSMRNYSGYIDKFELHMNPIITVQSTVQFDKRDQALNQAQTLVELLKNVGVDDVDKYRSALTEILTEAFPTIGGDVAEWNLNLDEAEEGGMGGGGF